jgi:hypothetical protein
MLLLTITLSWGVFFGILVAVSGVSIAFAWNNSKKSIKAKIDATLKDTSTTLTNDAKAALTNLNSKL